MNILERIAYGELKERNGIKKGRAEMLKKVVKVINNLLAEGLNGRRYNFMINGEDLKNKLTDLNKNE